MLLGRMLLMYSLKKKKSTTLARIPREARSKDTSKGLRKRGQWEIITLVPKGTFNKV